MSNVYNQNGFESREDYLNKLSEEYGVDITTVNTLANILGPHEDFDCLVTAINNISNTSK